MAARSYKIPEPPAGYEVDEENSTFFEIKYKLSNTMPKNYASLFDLTGYYLNSDSEVKGPVTYTVSSARRNIFPEREDCDAVLALAQLMQLRDVYNQGWVPDWNDNIEKFAICNECNEIKPITTVCHNKILTFQTPEIRAVFMDNFMGYLCIAKRLL
jgi:hypothetical protein